jgi:hypothetical protein
MPGAQVLNFVLKKGPKMNLILSHFNHTFLILNARIGPQVLRHTHCTFKKKSFLKCEEGSNSRFNLILSLRKFGSLMPFDISSIVP